MDKTLQNTTDGINESSSIIEGMIYDDDSSDSTKHAAAQLIVAAAEMLATIAECSNSNGIGGFVSEIMNNIDQEAYVEELLFNR